MKIGVLTFHWASNYGAVLQAYALQNALEKLGNDVEIIDYYPKRYRKNLLYLLTARRIKRIPRRFLEIRKERVIASFREEALNRSPYYCSDEALKKANLDYDCVICGSDQIWNESFLLSGEGKKTYTYFLNFVKSGTIKASYAASFGTVEYAETLKADLKEMLNDFDFISVRENTGLDILNDIGIKDACMVPDPSFLLDASAYEQHVESIRGEQNAFIYMLHGRDKDADPLIKHAKETGFAICECELLGIKEWLSSIYNSNLVITNSFHGVAFSILFHRPFVALMIEGSGMNDRIVTILNRLGLQDRIYNGDVSVIHQSIDWNAVEIKLEDYRREGYAYLDKILNYKQKG